MLRQTQGMSLAYAIVIGLVGLAIAGIAYFPLSEAWIYLQALNITSGVDQTTLDFFGDLIKYIPVAFVIAYVVGLFTTAQFQRNEV